MIPGSAKAFPPRGDDANILIVARDPREKGEKLGMMPVARENADADSYIFSCREFVNYIRNLHGIVRIAAENDK